ATRAKPWRFSRSLQSSKPSRSRRSPTCAPSARPGSHAHSALARMLDVSQSSLAKQPGDIAPRLIADQLADRLAVAKGDERRNGTDAVALRDDGIRVDVERQHRHLRALTGERAQRGLERAAGGAPGAAELDEDERRRGDVGGEAGFIGWTEMCVH